MKKKNKVILIVITSIVLLGIILGFIDYKRIKTGKMPLFMIRITDGGQSVHHYLGLGYRLDRKTGVSYKEPIYTDIEVKFGLWFYTKKIALDYDIDISSCENCISCAKDDFKMSFYTDKKEYKTTDKIKMWVTLKYIGKNDKITIYHAGSADSDTYIYYSITDGKDFNVESISNMMAKTTILDKNKLYHFDYQKSGGWSADAPDAKFWEDFYNEKDLYLPKGEYTIIAKSGFSISSHAEENLDLLCELKIKVAD